MSIQKKIAVFAVVMVVLIIGWIAFRGGSNSSVSVSPTSGKLSGNPVSSADFLVYRNTRVGYQFEYPKNGSISESIQLRKWTLDKSHNADDMMTMTFGGAIYAVQVQVSSAYGSLDEAIQKLYSSTKNLNDYEKITLDGSVAYTLKNGLVTYVILKGNLYSISGSAMEPTLHISTDLNDPTYAHLLQTLTAI